MTARPVSHPAANADCPDCKGDGFTVGRDGELAVAALCHCTANCPHCGGTGWVKKSEGFRAPVVRCACKRFEGRLRLFDEARIPARHANSTLLSFRDTSRLQTAAKMAVMTFVKDFESGDENRGIVLHGEVGRGKTHLMIAALRELIFRHGVSVRFIEFSHLLAAIKGGFDAGKGPAQLMEPLLRVEVLAIDELGKGRNTEFEGTVLDELVSKRYNAAATIIGTTNYPPRPATGVAAPNLAMSGNLPTLEDRVGPRVFSRLRETCAFVPVQGDDYRQRRFSR